MTRTTNMLAAVGLVALQACGSAGTAEDVGSAQEALTCADTPRSSESCANAKSWGFCGQSWFTGYCQITCGVCSAATGTGGSNGSSAATGGAASTATPVTSTSSPELTITTTTSGYCANVTLTNRLSSSTPKWQAAIDLNGSTITSSWAASFSGNTGKVSASPSGSTAVAPGATVSFGWCASANSGVQPKLLGWDFLMDVYAKCQTLSGVNPTRAALAVAMGIEMGRFEPHVDLQQLGYQSVAISSTGLARCNNGCKNTKAILGQMSAQPEWTDWLFDPSTFTTELVNGFARQWQNYLTIVQNTPSQTPPDHKATLVAGPINMGVGACGPHYVFQVDNPDGTPLTSKQAANMANWFCFYGMDGTNGFSCGSNPYIGFFQTGNGCPAGRTCIAIDPTDGDNSTTASTSAGSVATYPLNRVYDPTGSLLNSVCLTTTKKVGSLVSKCAIIPNTCGYDYCVAK